VASRLFLDRANLLTVQVDALDAVIHGELKCMALWNGDLKAAKVEEK